MYKSILLTDSEITLVSNVISSYLRDKTVPDARNLTIILNRFRDKKPTENHTQTVNHGPVSHK